MVEDSWSFDNVKLSASTLKSIERLGFTNPTSVQRATLPLFLSHKDVIVEAVTGSGKTLAFLIPVVEILLQSLSSTPLPASEVRALIISPTRELASQTFEVLNFLLTDLPKLKSTLLIGGADVQHDIERLTRNGCNIVVATPGRLLDIMSRCSTDVFQVRDLSILIMDEADRLLNLGFEKAITSILEKLPKQRRTGLFSATMSDALNQLIRTGLRNPVRITVKVENLTTKLEQKTPEKLKSYYIICEYDRRLGLLLDLLSRRNYQKCIVYFGTCASVEYFYKCLSLLPKKFTENLPSSYSLHGRMEHKKRTKIYNQFIESNRAVLFCTDLAARGLDFVDVDLVIQYEAPQDPTNFVHRCGRTARSGRSGESIIFISESEDAYIEFLSNRKVPLIEDDQYSSPEVLFEQLRSINGQDRDLLDKSVKAFVAFVRFYQEHQAKYIFNLKSLEIGLVAQSFGLLKLPKMPELKGIAVSNFEASSVKTQDIEYKDPLRNKQRKESFEALKRQKKEKIKPQANSFTKDIESARMKNRNTENKFDMGELDEDWREFKKAKRQRQ